MNILLKIRNLLGFHGPQMVATEEDIAFRRPTEMHFELYDVRTSNAQGFAMLADALDKNSTDAVLFSSPPQNKYEFDTKDQVFDFFVPDNKVEYMKTVLYSLGYKKVLKTDHYIRFYHEDSQLPLVSIISVRESSAQIILLHSQAIKILGQYFKTISLDVKLLAHLVKDLQREDPALHNLLENLEKKQIDVTAPWFQELCFKYGTKEVYLLFYCTQSYPVSRSSKSSSSVLRSHKQNSPYIIRCLSKPLNIVSSFYNKKSKSKQKSAQES